LKSPHKTIHPTAIISPNAEIHEGVSIGAFSIVHPNVVIGAHSTIDAFCEIGYPSELAEGNPLKIGKSSLIRSHSTVYEGSSFGERLITGHRVTIREKTVAGLNFQVGTLCDIQGDCTVGDYVRFHSNVHIGKHSTLGNFIWIFPYVVLTNDPHPPSDVSAGVTIDDFAAIATMSVVLPGVRICEGALVGANSSVNRDVAANSVVAGSPAKYICEASKLKLKDGSERPAYPWRQHFHRGYPSDVVSHWLQEFGNSRLE
jgi:acetyltransferase-like isoleucine patch superfamily enzyme